MPIALSVPKEGAPALTVSLSGTSGTKRGKLRFWQNWKKHLRVLQSADNSRLDECACLAVKNIGKPCAGKPHARFDEGGLAKDSMGWLFRHRQTKGAETDMPISTETGGCPLLYPFPSLNQLARQERSERTFPISLK